jgi:hypothetical protein
MSHRRTYGVLAIAMRHGRLFQKLVASSAQRMV